MEIVIRFLYILNYIKTNYTQGIFPSYFFKISSILLRSEIEMIKEATTYKSFVVKVNTQ